MGVAGRLYQTSGTSALPPNDQSAIREKVETFDVFTSDNAPHGERDFVAFEHILTYKLVAVARGVKMGRKPKLTAHQQREAIKRRDRGEPVREIARTYNVSHSTISRLIA